MTNKTWKFLMAGAAAAGLMFAGCEERRTAEQPEGVGGAGMEQHQQEEPVFGDNPGVLNDGEGPAENLEQETDTQIGDNPGVINDGEGPVESMEQETETQIGNEPGVINDGEGPVEENMQNQ